MTAPLVYYSRPSTYRQMRNIPNVGYVSVLMRSTKRVGYIQKPPYNVDTAYWFTEFVALSGWALELPGESLCKENEVAATNMARAKFVGQLGDSSSFGATLTAERRETWGTVVSGITKAVMSARAVSRGKLAEAAKILGFYPQTKRVPIRRARRKNGTYTRRATREVWVMPNGKVVAKTTANYWLWYSYGVKPLVSDIYNGMDVLTRPAPYHVVRGSGFSSSSRTLSGAPRNAKMSAKSSVSITAHVRVANPNLWLANQLGLINPVQWINEGIPFSFVVDWFSNLSQIIMQMTDFVGLEIAKPITTSKHVGVLTKTYPEYGYVTNKVQGTYFTRTLSIPTAKLSFAYERFQWQRGANAISLLIGFLKR